METVRSFIALEITPQIQKELEKLQNELKGSGADVKWIKPEGIHLTLKFLGNVSSEKIRQIKQVINQLAEKHKRFQLKVAKLGAFPKMANPRVIWAGIEQGKENIFLLAQDLEKQLAKLGFSPEKRAFHAHLTLGRVRSERKLQSLKEQLQSTDFAHQSMQINSLTLFKSTLTTQGSIYEILHKASLS